MMREDPEMMAGKQQLLRLLAGIGLMPS